MLAVRSPHQLIMKKPSRHQFRHVTTYTVHSVKENGETFFRARHLLTAPDNSEKDQLVKVELTNNHISKGQTLSFSFYKMEQKSDADYQAELDEYELQKKHEATKDAFVQATTAFNLVKKEIGQDDSKLEELAVAKKRLADFVANDGIPAIRKNELVGKWTHIIKQLEKTIVPVNSDLIDMKVRLAAQVAALQQDLELQSQIMSFKAKDYEGPDCPSEACPCAECKAEFRDSEDSYYSDPDYSDSDE